ncbi:hypothetical protein SAMN04487981_12322 [Streptomyces sp. cf386]|nr:hypothetical protein SAMN04487981_12322 [Streptomyces sp. cf386]
MAGVRRVPGGAVEGGALRGPALRGAAFCGTGADPAAGLPADRVGGMPGGATAHGPRDGVVPVAALRLSLCAFAASSGPTSPLFSDTGCLRMACFRLAPCPSGPLSPPSQPPSRHPTSPVTPSPPRLTLCRTSKFHPRFCTHTAHDGPPVRSDSLSGVISAIARGGTGAPALRPASTDDIRDRAAVAGLRGREGGARAPGTSCTPWARTSQRAASHPVGSSKLAHISPLISPRGIASKQTGHPASRRYAGGEETVLPSTSRNGARQEPEDNADQAGRSQGRAARKGRPGS